MMIGNDTTVGGGMCAGCRCDGVVSLLLGCSYRAEWFHAALNTPSAGRCVLVRSLACALEGGSFACFGGARRPDFFRSSSWACFDAAARRPSCSSLLRKASAARCSLFETFPLSRGAAHAFLGELFERSARNSSRKCRCPSTFSSRRQSVACKLLHLSAAGVVACSLARSLACVRACDLLRRLLVPPPYRHSFRRPAGLLRPPLWPVAAHSRQSGPESAHAHLPGRRNEETRPSLVICVQATAREPATPSPHRPGCLNAGGRRHARRRRARMTRQRRDGQCLLQPPPAVAPTNATAGGCSLFCGPAKCIPPPRSSTPDTRQGRQRRRRLRRRAGPNSF